MARQPVVRHNDWGSLTPATLGDWEPTLSVTVVVPTFNYQHTLPYVLAGLAAQSYPSHLLEVLVVDDQGANWRTVGPSESSGGSEGGGHPSSLAGSL